MAESELFAPRRGVEARAGRFSNRPRAAGHRGRTVAARGKVVSGGIAGPRGRTARLAVLVQRPVAAPDRPVPR